jgi:hypothetical protein
VGPPSLGGTVSVVSTLLPMFGPKIYSVYFLEKIGYLLLGYYKKPYLQEVYFFSMVFLLVLLVITTWPM